jgi:signal transduction histidine kinase
VHTREFATSLEVAIATHDLRNRVSVARFDVQTLRYAVDAKPDAGRPGLSDSLRQLECSLAHTSVLLEGLLEMTCADGGVRPDMLPRRIDLVSLTRRFVATGYRARHKRRLELNVHCGPLIGMWHVAQIRHLLRVLITNALQYSSAEREVIVGLERDGDNALLRITDAGSGIPANDVPRIVEPFFRGRFVESAVPGLGLGLTAARLIAEQYAGALEVQSVEGTGTTVVVRLPLGSV